jgi:hypothetical protein
VTPNPGYRSDQQSQRAFRLVVTVCAALLGMQSLWLLLPELIRPNINQLPTNARAASAAAEHHNAAVWAASVAQIRGDLWAQSAFTQADLLWPSNAKTDEALSTALQRAHRILDRALRNTPNTFAAWLMLAALTSRFNTTDRSSAIEPLKLSYYTGPSERELVPLRLEIAIRLESFNDFEMRQLINRDIRLLLEQKQEATIGKIYNTASVNAKSFMEQTIRNIDPSASDKIRNGQKQPRLLP